MKLLAALLLASSGNLSITPEMLKFNYIRFEGGAFLRCAHRLEDAAAQDWRVSCEGEGIRREYRVHLWVTHYTRNVEPRSSYEVLYWVTDLSEPGETHGVGTTIWFHLKDESALHSISVSQSVENDTAGLYLDLDPGKL
jgi:hypothetical protein